jgi:prevent-host-death family protein
MYTDCMESGHASMREARARFAELLDDAERGNVTLITRHGRAAAAIVPVALLGQLAEPGEALSGPEADPALQAAAASLRDALGALEPLLGREPAPAAAAAHAVPHQARPGRPGRAGLVAARLADLRGPAHGVVELPLRLFWSTPDRTFDLDQPSRLQAMYEAVLREASRPDDLTGYLNGQVLVAVWPELFLPKGVRRAWEDRHPALRAARLAAA